MTRHHSIFVQKRHAYTATDLPWNLDVNKKAIIEGVSAERRKNWRLLHYLSGGGMSVFGESYAHAIKLRRQSRFMIFAGILALLWVLFWFV